MKILLGVLLALTAQAGGAAKKSLSAKAKAEIDQSLAPLRKDDGVVVSLKKRSVNSLLSKEKTAQGTLHYWKGKLRVETLSPDETLMVMDGKTLWFATKLSKEMGGKTLVSKTSARSFKKSNAVFAALLDDGKLLEEFRVKSRAAKDGTVHLEMVPRTPEDSEIQKLDLWIKPEAKRLDKVTYWDDLENEVTFELGDAKPIDGDRQALFSYQPPKGAEVTEF